MKKTKYLLINIVTSVVPESTLSKCITSNNSEAIITIYQVELQYDKD